MTVIAIDGPAGAGKSTIAKALAQRLGLHYLDTGAMFRCVALAVLQRGIDAHDVDLVGGLSEEIEMSVEATGITVDGIDVSTQIRTPEVTAVASQIATNSRLRAELRHRQREWVSTRDGGVVEGRDIGSVVFPDAELKLYLTASAQVRAQRRVDESGGDVAEITAAIAERDARDRGRDDSPLVRADGSIVVDTSGLTVDEVLDLIESMLGTDS